MAGKSRHRASPWGSAGAVPPLFGFRVRPRRGCALGAATSRRSLEAGGARILISHGEAKNDVREQGGLTPTSPAPAAGRARAVDFTYAPGSRLVKTLMNPEEALRDALRRPAQARTFRARPDGAGGQSAGGQASFPAPPSSSCGSFSASLVSPVALAMAKSILGLARAIDRAQLTEGGAGAAQGLLDEETAPLRLPEEMRPCSIGRG